MTKIDIMSGFLGAGKTTLIKKLIEEAFSGEKLVLIENEFGEIGIDGGFLKDAGVQITEMNQGCICCSLVGDFGTALKQVIDQYAPDRVIIEPSGVGKLSDVIKAVTDVGEDADVVINSTTTVVDVAKCKMYMKNFGEFFNNQVESAGTIVLSRTQNVSESKVHDTVTLLREHNDSAVIITTPWDDMKGTVILDAMEHANTLDDLIADAVKIAKEHEHHHHHEHGEECTCGCHDHDHEHHDHHHEHEQDGHEHHHHHEHEQDGHEHHHHHVHGEECTCGCHDHHHEHHHADEVFTSWGKETAVKYAKEQLDSILSELAKEDCPYGVILRAKGIVSGKEGIWYHFDLVPGEYEVREGASDYTGKLCVIGSRLDETALETLFALN
ncbi:MAG: GTP-binding protein [Lachnospiraceae bacterium]|nr:GTP-binding protein [Lachnospiraceae bacterium]